MLRLPPLNALRAFEAAARHLSFRKAAAELCVTQGAVSRHVLNLERYLGIGLFARAHRGVTLTREGTAYLQEVRDAFLRISHATARVVSSPDENTLRIKLPPTCAIRWLVPRIGRFHGLHPGIAVQVTTSHTPADFERDGVDVSLHYGEPSSPGLVGERLFGEVLVPIGSKKLLGRKSRNCAPEDIVRHVLLHSIQRPSDWVQWFEAAGLKGLNTTRELTFENSALTYQGAVDGLGIALAQKAFVAEEIASGRLAAPSPIEVRNAAAYHLVFPAQHEAMKKVRAFRAWIAEEARATREAHRGL